MDGKFDSAQVEASLDIIPQPWFYEKRRLCVTIAIPGADYQ